MTHLVYCDNVGKKGERPIDKILAGIKTMVVRGAAGRKIVPPLEFEHQGNMDDWLIIDKIEDVVVGSSIPYNYEKSRF